MAVTVGILLLKSTVLAPKMKVAIALVLLVAILANFAYGNNSYAQAIAYARSHPTRDGARPLFFF